MRRIALLGLLGSLSIIACGGSDAATGPAQVDISGTYTLRTVNGAALPFPLGTDNAGNAVVLTDDQFVLTTALTYTEAGHETTRPISGAANVVTPESDVGTYTFVNGALTITSSGNGGQSTGSVVGATLTLVAPGIVAIYTK